MPADNPPRRITLIKVPYNYEWPGRRAVSCYRQTGEFLVKAEVADDAIGKGYALPGWASDKKAHTAGKRTAKSRATSPAKSAKPAANAATDNRTDDDVAGTDVPAPDRPDVRGAVDEAAG